MRRFILFFLLAIILACRRCAAQSLLTAPLPQVTAEYPEAFKKAGIRKARCIFKDAHGILWIGTDYGLYRYDGTNVDYIYHQANNPNSLPDNVVITVCQDGAGNIWAGCLQGVVCIAP